MNQNNRNGHRNNGHHNNNGLNQCKSQNVSSQPFIPASVNNRVFDRVPLHDTNRDLQRHYKSIKLQICPKSNKYRIGMVLYR